MIKKYKNNWKKSSKIRNRKYKIRSHKENETREIGKIRKFLHIIFD